MQARRWRPPEYLWQIPCVPRLFRLSERRNWLRINSVPGVPSVPCLLRFGEAGTASIRSTEETQSNGNTTNSLPHTGNSPGTRLGTLGTFLRRAFDIAIRVGLVGAPGTAP